MQLLIIQVITFVALLFVLRIMFYRQLSAALARLKRLHEENLAREEELKKELEKIKLEKEQELVRAKQEAERLIKEAKAKSEKLSTNMAEDAKGEVQKIKQQAQLELERTEKELHSRYKKQAVDLSVEMLKFAFTGQGQETLQHNLIDELIDEIKNLDKEKFSVKTKEARIESAYPLTSAEKEKLKHILSEKLGASVELHESKNTDIIAGLIVQLGSLTIDGSVRNKLAKALPLILSPEG